jgi:hypothetical protein
MSLIVTLRAPLAGWANPVLLPAKRPSCEADRPSTTANRFSSYALDRFSARFLGNDERSATGNRVRTCSSGLPGAALDLNEPLRRQPRETTGDKALNEDDAAQVHLRVGDFDLPVCLLACDDAPLSSEMASGAQVDPARPAFTAMSA